MHRLVEVLCAGVETYSHLFPKREDDLFRIHPISGAVLTLSQHHGAGHVGMGKGRTEEAAGKRKQGFYTELNRTELI